MNAPFVRLMLFFTALLDETLRTHAPSKGNRNAL